MRTASTPPGTGRAPIPCSWNPGTWEVEGTAQIHVVDTLTCLTISREGSTAALTSLSVKPGESVQLTVTGSYWGRTALRDWDGVTWTVEGDVGTVDENGLFTASVHRGRAPSPPPPAA